MPRFILHAADNVAIARVPLSPGQTIRVDGYTVTVEDAVPAGHKVALAADPGGRARDPLRTNDGPRPPARGTRPPFAHA